MSRRPRGTCPVCRATLSLRWSGEIKVLRKHGSGDDVCAGSGRPAVGELPELHLTPAAAAEYRLSTETSPGTEQVSAAIDQRSASDGDRIASVA